METKKAIIVAATAYMIHQFNLPFIDLLKSQSYEVHVACNMSNPGPMDEKTVSDLKRRFIETNVVIHDIPIPRNPLRIIEYLKAKRELKKIFKKNNYSLCHSHTPSGGVMARSVANKYRNKNLKSIYTAHGFHFYKGSPLVNWLVYYPIEKYFSKKTDKLITINTEDFYIASEKFYSDEVYLIKGMGVNLNIYHPPTKKEKNELRTTLGFRETDFILTIVGELNNNKNQLVVIEAISQLINKIPSLKLLIVGSGINEVKYKSVIKARNLSNSVYLLGYRSDIASILKASDALVSASKREGLPINVIEAVATGLPVICSNVRGSRDIIKDSINGLIVSDQISDIYADKIYMLWSNLRLRDTITKTNIECSKEYSVENIIIEHLKIYDL